MLPFNFPRDRGRTTVNVLGDAIGTGIVNYLSRDDLKVMEQKYDAIPLDQPQKRDNSAVLMYSSYV